MVNSAFKYTGLAQKLKRRIAVRSLQPGDRLPTEEELVQEYGFSRITVRRALSILEDDGLVSRKRKSGTFVNRAISESLELDHIRGRVVVAIPAMENSTEQVDYALSAVLRGLEQFLAEHGFSVQVMSMGGDAVRDRARILRLADYDDLEGLCAVGPCLEPYQNLLKSIPHVNSCTFTPGALPWVGMDMEEATYTLMRCILGRGHRKVAMICGPWIDSRAFAIFVKGYKRALEEWRIPFRRNMLRHAYEGESLVELAEQALKEDSAPTAVFAEDWRIARGVLRACHHLGLKIPQDVSLGALGQNTQYLASAVGITAYVPNNEKVGRRIGEILMGMIDEKIYPNEPVFIPGRLVEHESIAPPKAEL